MEAPQFNTPEEIEVIVADLQRTNEEATVTNDGYSQSFDAWFIKVRGRSVDLGVFLTEQVDTKSLTVKRSGEFVTATAMIKLAP